MMEWIPQLKNQLIIEIHTSSSDLFFFWFCFEYVNYEYSPLIILVRLFKRANSYTKSSFCKIIAINLYINIIALVSIKTCSILLYFILFLHLPVTTREKRTWYDEPKEMVVLHSWNNTKFSQRKKQYTLIHYTCAMSCIWGIV